VQLPHRNDRDCSPEIVKRALVKKAWVEAFPGNDPLLFGSQQAMVDLGQLHPERWQIVELWGFYLRNVNSLFKVTHVPSLEGPFFDAADDPANIPPTLAALMFSIYCIGTRSLTEDQCKDIFGSRKEDLLARYSFGCRQALLECDFLRSEDRDSLTALFLYLVGHHPPRCPPNAVRSL
jgi:hypothetical protein